MRCSAILAVAFASSLLAGPVSANFYLEATGATGSANQVWEARDPRFSVDFESISVNRFSLGGKMRLASQMEVGFEAAWSRRGGVYHTPRTIFRPEAEPETVTGRRAYLDLSVPVRRVWNLGLADLGVSVLPRLSVNIEKDTGVLSQLDPEPVVFGCDPDVRLAVANFFVWGRYCFDFTDAYRTNHVSVHDRARYVGIGARIL